MRRYAEGMQKAAYVLGMNPETFNRVAEMTGLAALSAYPAYEVYRGLQEDKPVGKNVMELAGLGLLGAPTIMKILKGH